jgi:hypothetical protein
MGNIRVDNNTWNSYVHGGLSADKVTVTDGITAHSLYVNGTTTTVSSTNLDIKDPLIGLNSGFTGANTNDSGLIIERGTSGDNAAVIWDESTNKFVMGTTAADPSSTGNLTVTTGTLVANINGSVTGGVTGSINIPDDGVIQHGSDWEIRTPGSSPNQTFEIYSEVNGNTEFKIADTGSVTLAKDLYSPSLSTLSLSAQGLSAYNIYTRNRVGINKTDPQEALHVDGNIATSGTSPKITLTNDPATNGDFLELKVVNSAASLSVGNTNGGNSFEFLKSNINGAASDDVGLNASSGTISLRGDAGITAYDNFAVQGTIQSTSYEAADFPTTSTVRTTAAFKEDGTMVQDEKVIVKKVTGAQAKAMTTNSSTFIELIPAPGANKVIVVRELEIFIDRGTWTPMSGGQVRGWGGNLQVVIETPAKTNAGVGSSNFDYNTYATLQKKYLNHTINNVFVSANAVDTIIVRDAPVTQTRAYPNKPLLLKPEAAATYSNLFTYSQTVDDDYYFRITYKILDMNITTDFAVTTT